MLLLLVRGIFIGLAYTCIVHEAPRLAFIGYGSQHHVVC